MIDKVVLTGTGCRIEEEEKTDGAPQEESPRENCKPVTPCHMKRRNALGAREGEGPRMMQRTDSWHGMPGRKTEDMRGRVPEKVVEQIPMGPVTRNANMAEMATDGGGAVSGIDHGDGDGQRNVDDDAGHPDQCHN
jgi:hypothetical protein